MAYRNIASQQITYIPSYISTSTTFNQCISIPDNAEFPDGIYEVLPVFRSANSQEWEYFYFADNIQEFVRVEIKNGERIYTNVAPEGKVYLDNLVYLIDEDKHRASLISYIPGKSSKLTNYVIPDEIEYKNVTYPVTEIGKQAFESHYCSINLTIGANIESILDAAFCYVHFEDLQFPENCKLTTIGSNSFVNSRFENAVILPQSLKEISWAAFNGARLPSIEIPNSVTNIGGLALNTAQLNDIFVHWRTPLPCTEIFGFDSQPEFMATNISQITLHVPTGFKSEYESTYPWNLVWRVVDDQTKITNIDSDLKIIFEKTDNGFRLLNADGYKVTVFNTTGNIVSCIQNYCGQNFVLPAGLYIININNQITKIII